jgi:hypothetical protein
LKHSRYRARKRKTKISSATVGAAVRGLAFLLIVIVCVAGIRWISGYAKSYSAQWRRSETSNAVSLSTLAGPHVGEITARNQRLVYPYSVIPGGVRSAAELRDATAHDTVAAEHYAGFDYKRARIVEVSEPKLVYLSYRRKNKIYWTRKQASLHPGEKLLTDGHITARTRCANQVSVLPQANTSPEEPEIAELDRPDAVASGTEVFPNLSSSLLSADPGIPAGPTASGPGGTSGGFGPPSTFIPLPIGGPGGTTPPKTGGGSGCTKNNCTPPPPPPPPPPAVPEPGTFLLVGSGAAAVIARLRSRR